MKTRDYVMSVVAFILLGGGFLGAMVAIGRKEAEDYRQYNLPENCTPYAEEPRGGGASCPRKSHRGHIEKLANGGALLVCECPR